MTKFGIAGEKHDHSPPEYGCTFYSSHPCRAQHRCCYYCEIFYRCQEGRCMQAWASMRTQPHPMPFRCRHAKRIEELTWDLILVGTDVH